MKKVLLFVALSLIIQQNIYAQKAEVSLLLNGNTSHFSGSGKTLSRSDDSRLGYGIAAQIQSVSSRNWLFGIQAGYEKLNTNTTETDPNIFFDGFYTLYTANYSRTAYFQNNFINLNPYFGYRLKLDKIAVDLMPGIDLAILTKGQTAVNVVNGTEKVKLTTDREQPSTDFRLKFGVNAAYNRIGINVSYAHGLTNYLKPYHSSNFDYSYHTELFRFGLSYRIL